MHYDGHAFRTALFWVDVACCAVADWFIVKYMTPNWWVAALELLTQALIIIWLFGIIQPGKPNSQSV